MKLIYAYTRQQAIEDGVLIDLMQPPFLELVANAGIKFPVAMTVDAFERYVKVGPNAHKMCNDIMGRCWDVLWMFAHAAKRGGSEILFEFYCVVE